jgi:hypothetical protein
MYYNYEHYSLCYVDSRHLVEDKLTNKKCEEYLWTQDRLSYWKRERLHKEILNLLIYAINPLKPSG